MPTASVYNTGAQSLPTPATWTTLAFDAEVVDNDTIHNPASNNSRLTFTTAGTYLIVGQVPFDAATNSVSLACRLFFDGTTTLAPIYACGSGQNGNGPTLAIILTVSSAARWVELQAWQNSGGALSTRAGLDGPTFGMTRVAAA